MNGRFTLPLSKIVTDPHSFPLLSRPVHDKVHCDVIVSLLQLLVEALSQADRLPFRALLTKGVSLYSGYDKYFGGRR